MPPGLHTSIPPTRPYTRSTPPDLFGATSLRLHHTSRAPELLRQTPPRPRARSMPPELRAPYLYTSTSLRLQRTSRPPRPQARSMPPELQISIPLNLHVYTRAAHLQTSIPLHLHIYTPAARLQASIPPSSHVPTPSARLQRSRSPYLSTSACLQRSSSAPPAPLQRSIPPRVHVRKLLATRYWQFRVAKDNGQIGFSLVSITALEM